MRPEYLVAVLLALSWSTVESRLEGRDLDQLTDFILDRNSSIPEQYDDLPLPVNRTVRLAIDGLLDRLRCVQQGLTHLQCLQCLQPAVVLKTLRTDEITFVTNRLDLEKLSVILLNHVLHFRTICRSPSKTCNSYAECKEQLAKRLPSPLQTTKLTGSRLLEDVESVLREIKGYYEPLPERKCFSAENIISEIAKEGYDDGHLLEELSSQIMAHILIGDCIDVGEAVTDFLEDIFLHYGDRCSRVISQIGFEKLMNDLRSQDRDEHEDHGMSDNLCSNESPNERLITMTEFGGIPTELLDHNVYRTKPEPKRTERSTRESATHKHRSLASECLSADGLLKKFLLTPSQQISPVQFLQLCPALVQQVVSGVCNFDSNVTKKLDRAKPSNLEIYGYGTLAVFIISLSSLCGIFLFPILAKNYYKYIMMGFIGLSFGTMAGDAFLHLIPQALGLHSHEEKEDTGEHEDLNFDSIPSYIWLQLGVFSAIYALFLFEAAANIVSSKNEEHGHGHSHVPDKIPGAMVMKNMKNQTEQTNYSVNTVSATSLPFDDEIEKTSTPMIKSTDIIWGLTTMSLVIVIGDVLHNFGDGLAIGASFAPGLQGGVSTSLAVFCHELPHEFGDFVVLLSTGLSFKKALFVNFVSALFSFVGLYIGIQLGEDNVTRTWILSATAGIFVYVALTEMLPELKTNNADSPWLMFLLKNIGILSGVFIMMIIAVFEDHFHL